MVSWIKFINLKNKMSLIKIPYKTNYTTTYKIVFWKRTQGVYQLCLLPKYNYMGVVVWQSLYRNVNSMLADVIIWINFRTFTGKRFFNFQLKLFEFNVKFNICGIKWVTLFFKSSDQLHILIENFYLVKTLRPISQMALSFSSKNWINLLIDL